MAITIIRAEFENKQQENKFNFPVDTVLIFSITTLLVLGIIMVASASISIADRGHADPFYYLNRQLIRTLLGLILSYIVFKIPLKYWQQMGPILIVSSILLLLILFVPGLGREVNGSVRWISLGVINIQVSESVKLFTIIYLSGYLVRHQAIVSTEAGGFIRPLLLLVIIVALLMLQPDYGAAVILLATSMSLMWLAGVRLIQYFLLLIVVSTSLIILAVTSPYRLQRLTIFLNPWEDPFDSGFQLTQALIAIGRGEWFGVGLGASVQKLFYLPEAHTDFLFSVIAEELGLFGAFSVLLLFTIVILRAFRIARKAEYANQQFAAYMAYGIGIWVGLQAYINIGVNMGILPTKGLTLPLMSYGGSSIIIMCIALTLLLRVDYETRKIIKPGNNKAMQKKVVNNKRRSK